LGSFIFLSFRRDLKPAHDQDQTQRDLTKNG
jgi:hypothetical protein